MKTCLTCLFLLIAVLLSGCEAASPALPDTPDSSFEIQDKNELNTEEPEKSIAVNAELSLLQIEYSDLNLIPKKRELELHYARDGILYGSIVEDVNISNGLLETKALVFHDINAQTTTVVDYSSNKRIFDYAIQDETLYYVTVEYYGDEYLWKLYQSDMYFHNPQELASGVFVDPFLSPVFNWEKDQLYMAYPVTNEDGSREHRVAALNDGSLQMLASFADQSEMVLPLRKMRVFDGYVYSICQTEFGLSLVKKSINDAASETVYTAPKGKNLSGFLVAEDYVFITELSGATTRIVSIDDGGENSVKYTATFGYESFIHGGEYILTHNHNGSFSVLDRLGKEIGIVSPGALNLQPKYLAYNDCTVIVQDHESTCYLLEIMLEEYVSS